MGGEAQRSNEASALRFSRTPQFRTHVHPNSLTTRTLPTTPAYRIDAPEIAKTENQTRPKKKGIFLEGKRNKGPTSQGLHGLVWPFLRYLDLEFAHTKFEVDEFRDEVLCLRFEDLFGKRGSGTSVRQVAFGVWGKGVGRA